MNDIRDGQHIRHILQHRARWTACRMCGVFTLFASCLKFMPVKRIAVQDGKQTHFEAENEVIQCGDLLATEVRDQTQREVLPAIQQAVCKKSAQTNTRHSQ